MDEKESQSVFECHSDSVLVNEAVDILLTFLKDAGNNMENVQTFQLV